MQREHFSEKGVKEKGFSQAAIARKAGMSPCKLSQVVNLELPFRNCVPSE